MNEKYNKKIDELCGLWESGNLEFPEAYAMALYINIYRRVEIGEYFSIMDSINEIIEKHQSEIEGDIKRSEKIKQSIAYIKQRRGEYENTKRKG